MYLFKMIIFNLITTFAVAVFADIFKLSADGDAALLVKLLEEDRTLVNLRDEHGQTILHFACAHGHIGISYPI